MSHTHLDQHIRTLVMTSSDDMVNWTYYGLINTAGLSPWSQNSWVPEALGDWVDHFNQVVNNPGDDELGRYIIYSLHTHKEDVW